MMMLLQFSILRNILSKYLPKGNCFGDGQLKEEGCNRTTGVLRDPGLVLRFN
jgi:hypothetical protein